jgi:hypothetical protein
MTYKASSSTLQIRVLSIFVLLAALSRMLPHPPNFTPIAGMALFGAAHFSRRWMAWLVPLLAFWISDLFINYGYFQKIIWLPSWGLWTYGPMALIVLLGIRVLKKISPARVVGSSLGASLLFFLISNFGVWLGGTIYPPTPAGLMSCYAAGIPFFGNTLLGDLFYCAVLFGGFALAQRQVPALQTSRA